MFSRQVPLQSVNTARGVVIIELHPAVVVVTEGHIMRSVMAHLKTGLPIGMSHSCHV